MVILSSQICRIRHECNCLIRLHQMKIHGVTIKPDDIVGIVLGDKPYMELQPRLEYSTVPGSYTDQSKNWTRIHLTKNAGARVNEFLNRKRSS